MLLYIGKTCNKDLPNNINVSANAKQVLAIQPVSGNVQILFSSLAFTCNGTINQITAWYQIHAEVNGNSSIIVDTSIKFQIWHPTSHSQYKLVSETSLPSAIDDQPRVVDNLTLPFYSGSILGIYVGSFGYKSGTLTLLTNNDNDVPQSFLYVTNDKPCVFDTTATGVLQSTTVDAEVVLDYGTYVNKCVSTSQ